jgi:hypothetical protein
MFLKAEVHTLPPRTALLRSGSPALGVAQASVVNGDHISGHM